MLLVLALLVSAEEAMVLEVVVSLRLTVARPSKLIPTEFEVHPSCSFEPVILATRPQFCSAAPHPSEHLPLLSQPGLFGWSLLSSREGQA